MVAREATPQELFARLLALLRRAPKYWLGALVVGAAVGVLGGLYVVRQPRVYESETVVLVSEAIHAESHEDSIGRGQRIGPRLKDLLLSRSRLERIITELNLYPTVVDQRGMLDAVDIMRNQIGFRARASDTFLISFQSGDPAQAQRVTARLADTMIDDFVKERAGRAGATRDFLQDEQRRVDADLDNRSQALAVFLAQHPEFAALPGQPRPPWASAAPSSVKTFPSDPALAALRREKAQLEARLAGSASAKPRSLAAPQVDERTGALEQARAKALAENRTAQAELEEKRQRLTEEHPDLIAARKRALAAARALQAAEAAVITGQAAAELAHPDPGDLEPSSDLDKRLTAVRSAILMRERDLANAGASPGAAAVPVVPEAGLAPVPAEAEWQKLVQGVSDARRYKEEVTDQAARADLAASATFLSGNMIMTVVDPAFKPMRPVKPNRPLGMILAALAGALTALSYAGVRVLVSDVVLDAVDLEKATGQSVLAVVPPRGSKRNSVPPPQNDFATYDAGAPISSRRQGRADERMPPSSRGVSDLVRARRATPMVGDGGTYAMDFSEWDQPKVVIDLDARTGRAQRLVGPTAATWGMRVGSATEIHPATEALSALRLLRHQIEQRSLDGNVLAIMSASGEEGKSTMAAQLAMVLAESDRAHVLLIEANFVRPSLERSLSLRIPHGCGFSSQLKRRIMSRAPHKWYVTRLGGSLDVLAEGERDKRWPSTLHSRAFRDAIQECRANYDYVVLDGPSVLEGGEANAIEEVSQGVVLVGRAGVSQKTRVARATKIIGTRRLLGFVLVDSR